MLLALYIIFSFLFLLFSKVYLGSQAVVKDISISAKPVVKDGGGTPRGLDSGKNCSQVGALLKERESRSDGRGTRSPDTLIALPGALLQQGARPEMALM